MSKKIKVIVNPIAGSGRAKRLLARLQHALDNTEFEPTIKTTTRPGDAQEEAKEIQGFSTLVCIGGDGTINEVINGLLNSARPSLPLGIIPVGSGNVIAKELKLSRDITRFMNLLKQGKTTQLDVGSVSFPRRSGIPKQSLRGQVHSGLDSDKPPDRKFISMAGIGFDAEVTRVYHLQRKGARLQAHLFSYLPLGIKTIARYKVPRISIEIDGRLVTKEACFLQVANGHSYGGPFVFAKQARPDDGLLDILWFTGRSRYDILRYFWSALIGKAEGRKDAHYQRGKKIVLSSPEKVPIQVDGDCCGYLPVMIEIIPQTVAVLTA